MFKIRNNKITLTRGDTAVFDLNLTDSSDESEFVIEDGTVAKMTVRNELDGNILFSLEADASLQFKIKPSLTKDLAYGEYCYDIQLSVPCAGEENDVYTVVPYAAGNFKLTEEVTV